MGMAASQARYLQLAARKSNVEFEGQQINQERTILSTESSQFYSQLTALVVPVAPSSSQFTQTKYTFSDGNNNYDITNIQNLNGDPNYNKTVTYEYTTTAYTGIAQRRSDLGVQNVGGTYWLTDGANPPTNKTKLVSCNEPATDPNYATDQKSILQICKDNPGNANNNPVTPAGNFAADAGYNAATQTIAATTPNIYKYTDPNGVIRYYSLTDLNAAAALVPAGQATALSSYYASNISKQVVQTSPAYVTSTNSGRYSQINIQGYSQPFDLTTNTTINETAYNDAVNEYQYRQQAYTQQVQGINAQISIIQNEDQQLELRIHELDTEQQALATEMDSVKKVIDKNIESTFKAFND